MLARRDQPLLKLEAVADVEAFQRFSAEQLGDLD